MVMVDCLVNWSMKENIKLPDKNNAAPGASLIFFIVPLVKQ